MKEAQLRMLVAEVIEANPAEINSDTDLRSLPGFDSVNILSLMIVLDERMGIRLGPEQAANLKYMRELEQIAREQGKL
jgi:acyl carrier protein